MNNSTTQKKSLTELYALWNEFGNTAVLEDGECRDSIAEPFLHFGIATPREDIWRWFEEQHPDFLVGEVMQGIRKESVSAD